MVTVVLASTSPARGLKVGAATFSTTGAVALVTSKEATSEASLPSSLAMAFRVQALEISTLVPVVVVEVVGSVPSVV